MKIAIELSLFFLVLQLTKSCDDGSTELSIEEEDSKTFEINFSSPEELEQKIRDNAELQELLLKQLSKEATGCDSTSTVSIATTVINSLMSEGNMVTKQSTVVPTHNTRTQAGSSATQSTQTLTSSETNQDSTTYGVTTRAETTTPSTQTTKTLSCAEKYPELSSPSPTTSSGDACLNGTCFRAIISERQNITYDHAGVMCQQLESNWSLANIYDECYFELIKNYSKTQDKKEFNLWTGMTITPENSTAYFRSGEITSWSITWYPNDYPNNENVFTNLAFRYSGIWKYDGLVNIQPDHNYDGALCEKQN
ncbi:uncharacterized protein LOC120338170 isoform X2 [Styela clava]